jgi:hypothetical protein
MLEVRIPKRRGPPLAAPVQLAIGRSITHDKQQASHPALVLAERPRALA